MSDYNFTVYKAKKEEERPSGCLGVIIGLAAIAAGLLFLFGMAAIFGIAAAVAVEGFRWAAG